MKRQLIVLIAAISSGLTFAQLPGDFYTIDASHSTLMFKARHIGGGSVVGRFDAYEGTIYFDPSDLSATSASLIAEARSINTNGGFRDTILVKEFFQADLYPYVTFESTGSRIEGGQYFLNGNLSMGSFTKEVEIPFEHISGPSKDQFSHFRITLNGDLTVDRTDYDLKYRSNDFWDGIVADEVKIEIESGARVYNSLETIFPFRENSIGRIAFDAYQEGGSDLMRKKVEEVLADPENYITNNNQLLRGATHLAQSNEIAAAIDLIDLGIEKIEMVDEWKSEFLARKSKYYLQMGKSKQAAQFSKEALELNPNSLAKEVLKKTTK